MTEHNGPGRSNEVRVGPSEVRATDELRRLLDERGVEYNTNGERYGTWYDTPLGGRVYVAENNAGCLHVNSHAMTPEQAIAATLGNEINGETSDGYHTFNELYHHRAVLFSVIVDNYRDDAWKAKKHHDGTMYDGMFIVGIDTPWGQASYHYDLDPYWDMYDCEEREAAPEWDGHTPDDAIERIGKLAALGGNGYKQECEVDGTIQWQWTGPTTYYEHELSCGHVITSVDEEPPNYCEECGARVRKAVKQ